MQCGRIGLKHLSLDQHYHNRCFYFVFARLQGGQSIVGYHYKDKNASGQEIGHKNMGTMFFFKFSF